MQRTRRRSPAVLGLAAAAVATGAVLIGCSNDDDEASSGFEIDPAADTSPDDGVDLLFAGADDGRRAIAVSHVVGDTGTTARVEEITSTSAGADDAAGGLGLPPDFFARLEYDIEHTIVEAGDTTARSRFVVTRYEASDSDDLGDVAGQPLASAVGRVFLADLGTDTVPLVPWTAEDGAPAPDGFGEFDAEPEVVPFVLPVEPVGVGAVWSAESEFPDLGVPLTVVTRFELVELSPDRFVVEYESSGLFDDVRGGNDVRFDVRADGRLSGSSTDAFDVEHSVDITSSLDATIEGADGPQTVGATIERSTTVTGG